LETLYGDRLEGRISPEMYDGKAQELRAQAADVSRKLNQLRSSAPAPVQAAIDVMDLTSRAADVFSVQPPYEKQEFLRLVLRRASWQHGKLHTEFEMPFENLRVSNQLALTKQDQNTMNKAEIGVWHPKNMEIKPLSPIFNLLKIKGERRAIGDGWLTAERGGK